MPSSGPGWASLISPIDCGPQHALRAQSPDAIDDTSGCIEIAPVDRVGLLASARPAEGMKQTIECSQRKAAFPWRGVTAQWHHARRDDEASVWTSTSQTTTQWRSARDPR